MLGLGRASPPPGTTRSPACCWRCTTWAGPGASPVRGRLRTHVLAAAPGRTTGGVRGPARPGRPGPRRAPGDRGPGRPGDRLRSARRAVQALLRLGHTSGGDLAHGIAAGALLVLGAVERRERPRDQRRRGAHRQLSRLRRAHAGQRRRLRGGRGAGRARRDGHHAQPRPARRHGLHRTGGRQPGRARGGGPGRGRGRRARGAGRSRRGAGGGGPRRSPGRRTRRRVRDRCPADGGLGRRTHAGGHRGAGLGARPGRLRRGDGRAGGRPVGAGVQRQRAGGAGGAPQGRGGGAAGCS